MSTESKKGAGNPMGAGGGSGADRKPETGGSMNMQSGDTAVGKAEGTDYGNWVPIMMMKICGIVLAVLLLIELAGIGLFQNLILNSIIGILFLATLAFTLYMWRCRNLFAFEKGGLMGKVHEYLVGHLSWDGEGTLLDIGCGAGALTIRCAKRFPKAALTGVDYWSAEWSYAKEQCEKNARAEGVADRIHFQKEDAAKLGFKDETFDAAVSNFVFHEVRTQPEKREVVREALRVVKKGGAFAFQDLFAQKQLYGDMEEFLGELRREGISEIHYIADVEKKGFIPKFVQAPWMLHGIGLIYGRK